MNALWPSVGEERLMQLAGRVASWRRDGLIPPGEKSTGGATDLDAAIAVPWKSNGLVASSLFFVLASLAVAFTWFLFDLLDIPGMFVTAIAIATAEALIVGQRWFGTGVESALWLGGLLAFIFSLPSSGRPEALLVVAAGVLIAGARVRNPLLVTAAAILVVAYLGARDWPEAAIVSGIVAGIIALIAGTRIWHRPSTELLWDALLVLMPLAGIITGAVAGKAAVRPSWALVFAALAVAALRVGLRTRDHAPLLAGFVDLCVAYGILQGNDLLPWKVEAHAIAAGVLLIGIAAAINRGLRGRVRGITATPETMGELEELAQLAGAIHVQHRGEPAPSAPQPVSGGGSFGGAGATGDF